MSLSPRLMRQTTNVTIAKEETNFEESEKTCRKLPAKTENMLENTVYAI